MRFEQVAARVDGIPFTSLNKARLLYDLVLEARPREVLELGFAHGVSTCYLAGALDEIGGGRITTVDRDLSAACQPSAEELLDDLGLRRSVEIVRVPSCYTWFLRDQLREDPNPRYDLCFLDGSKDWTVDGLAFFLVDRLLREGAWLVLDDYSWVAPGPRPRWRGGEDREAHVREVFDLLVRPHPDYSEFRVVDEEVALARKIRARSARVTFESRWTLRYKIVSTLRREWRRLLGRLRRSSWAGATARPAPRTASGARRPVARTEAASERQDADPPGGPRGAAPPG